MQISEKDLALIEKYNRPGPRYTSYPPANHFREYRNAVTAAVGERWGCAAVLYFHLPFCETLCWFCGCHQITTRNRDRADDYLDLIEKELALFAEYHQPEREWCSCISGEGRQTFFVRIRLIGSGR